MTSSPPILHLYRRLLRESGYLAVPQSRTYIKDYVVSQFRHHARLPSQCPPPDPLPREKEISLQRRARKFLSVLTRANLGHYDPFNRVLDLTFARKGPRRRQLMHHLMHPSSPALHPSPLQAMAEPGTTWEPPALIKALLDSQHKHESNFTQIGYKIIPNGPDLPPTNIWGKPMPHSRTKNAWARWYATYTDRLLPPLPEAEYQSILAIAEGKVKLKGRVRRTKASEAVFAKESELELEQVDDLLADPKNKQKKLSGRVVTERFVQRRMTELLGHIPQAITPIEQERPTRFLWRNSRGAGQVPVYELNESQTLSFFG